MKISYEKLTIEINYSELIDIYCALKLHITDSIKNHWICYSVESFKNNCTKLQLLKTIVPFVQMNFEEDMKEFENLFKLR